MKERPIIFSVPMVRALLEGRKSMTRRIVKPQPPCSLSLWADTGRWTYTDTTQTWKCPYGVPGDRLWVRETHCISWAGECLSVPRIPDKTTVGYKADYGDNRGIAWRPSIHMPRWASRLTLEITAVRVERLQEITEEDAISEGVDAVYQADVPRQATWSRRQDFTQLWESIHGPGSWEQNPWVWVIEFKKA